MNIKKWQYGLLLLNSLEVYSETKVYTDRDVEDLAWYAHTSQMIADEVIEDLIRGVL